ncbi:MAG: DUF4097 domain-containing protein [Candidatus Krumholzibacteria bacterium]|jgi:DUF4097 and DUF4098 domain-containing protein YvlB|nr:DUF4097 domain-containing protein [Candidatus Krumholzibacteria bacterium]
MRIRHLTVLLVAALAAAAASPSARCAEIRRDYHESFRVESGSILRLVNGDGDVTVRKWDRDVIDIEVHYLAEYKSFGSGERDFTVEFGQDDRVVEVEGREKSGATVGFLIFDVKEYTYTIKAPDYVILDITGDDGSVDVEDWKGDVEIDFEDGDILLTGGRSADTRIRSGDGEIEVENHEGNIDIEVEDGPISIRGSRTPRCVISGGDGEVVVRDSEGDFGIETDDGNIDLYRVKAGRIDILTSDGGVDIELHNTDTIDMDVRTADGDVMARFAEGLGAVFTIDTDGGVIRTDLPSAVNLQKGENWLSGRLPGGRGNIRIRTENGAVTLKHTK